MLVSISIVLVSTSILLVFILRYTVKLIIAKTLDPTVGILGVANEQEKKNASANTKSHPNEAG